MSSLVLIAPCISKSAAINTGLGMDVGGREHDRPTDNEEYDRRTKVVESFYL